MICHRVNTKSKPKILAWVQRDVTLRDGYVAEKFKMLIVTPLPNDLLLSREPPLHSVIVLLMGHTDNVYKGVGVIIGSHRHVCKDAGVINMSFVIWT